MIKSLSYVRSKEFIKVFHLYLIFLDFSSVLPEVEKAINEADFLCVDTEFSGTYKLINICSQNIRNIHFANFKY